MGHDSFIWDIIIHMQHESFVWDLNHSYFTRDITTQGMGASRGSRNSKEGKMRENQARKDLIRSSRMISQTRGEVKSLDKAGRFLFSQKTPTFPQTSSIFPLKSPVFPQKSPIFPPKSPTFPLLAYDFANTWKSQVSRQGW